MKRIGPRALLKRPYTVAKIRRNKTQAYGDRNTWYNLCLETKRRDGFKCRCCGATEFLQVDHIIPVSKGGRSTLANLWTICDVCHTKRPGHKQARQLILYKRNSRTQT